MCKDKISVFLRDNYKSLLTILLNEQIKMVLLFLKTKCVHYFRHRDLNPNPENFIWASQIAVIKHFLIFELIFWQKMWAMNLIKILLNTSWGADHGSLLKIYCAVIHSKKKVKYVNYWRGGGGREPCYFC